MYVYTLTVFTVIVPEMEIISERFFRIIKYTVKTKCGEAKKQLFSHAHPIRPRPTVQNTTYSLNPVGD